MRRDPSDMGDDRIVLSEEDEAELHKQLIERNEAQRQRDYETADRIRECMHSPACTVSRHAQLLVIPALSSSSSLSSLHWTRR